MLMTIDEVTENRSSLEQHIFTWCTIFPFLLNTLEDCVLGYLLQFFLCEIPAEQGFLVFVKKGSCPVLVDNRFSVK
jgi:hypothetical protein